MSSAAPSQWYKDAIFYEVYIRAFCDSNGDGHGDLRGVASKLDYLKELGVDCIWLMPMYASPLKDDGYDISDYTQIHPDYGTVEDFEYLLREAHRRGLRIITDLVLNHTSDQHPWFVESRSSRENPKRDWYVWSDTDRKYEAARIIFLDVEKTNWTLDAATGQYYWHRFYASQPDLNFDNPEVRQAMKDVMSFWLDKGIDGFRVDAVPYLYEREGTNCENLPETHLYVQELRGMIDERWPEAILLAEANQLPEDVFAYFGTGDEFHMAFHFPQMPRIFMVMKTEQAGPIKDIMARTPPIPANCQWCTFLRNHDELTLEMVAPEERQWMWEIYAPDPRYRLNLGIRRRLAPLLDNDPRKILLANAILFSLPGTPIIYYGDEIGMGDNIALPDRNGVRTPMQWDASPNGGFSNLPSGKLYAPVIDDPEYGYQRVNVEAQRRDPQSLYNQMRYLIALRKQYRAFALGTTHFIDVDNPNTTAWVRMWEDEVFIVVHNLTGETQYVSLDQAAFLGRSPVNVLGLFRQREPIGEQSPYRVTMNPYESKYFLLIRPEQEPPEPPSLG